MKSLSETRITIFVFEIFDVSKDNLYIIVLSAMWRL